MQFSRDIILTPTNYVRNKMKRTHWKSIKRLIEIAKLILKFWDHLKDMDVDNTDILFRLNDLYEAFINFLLCFFTR